MVHQSLLIQNSIHESRLARFMLQARIVAAERTRHALVATLAPLGRSAVVVRIIAGRPHLRAPRLIGVALQKSETSVSDSRYYFDKIS